LIKVFSIIILGNNIIIPANSNIYNQYDLDPTPIMFEITTSGGLKIHSGLMNCYAPVKFLIILGRLCNYAKLDDERFIFRRGFIN
jgi:hypothetical protein